MLSLQGPREALKRIVFGPNTYLVPREDGLVVVGATSEPEASFQEGLTPDGQKQLQRGLESRCYLKLKTLATDGALVGGSGPHSG